MTQTETQLIASLTEELQIACGLLAGTLKAKERAEAQLAANQQKIMLLKLTRVGKHRNN